MKFYFLLYFQIQKPGHPGTSCFLMFVCVEVLWTSQPNGVMSILFRFVLRFYGPINPMGSCRAGSVYLTALLHGRLSPLSWSCDQCFKDKVMFHTAKKKIIYMYIYMIKLTHYSLETPKRVTGKQCRPRSDTAECHVWSPLFSNSSTIFLSEYLNHIAWHT